MRWWHQFDSPQYDALTLHFYTTMADQTGVNMQPHTSGNI